MSTLEASGVPAAPLPVAPARPRLRPVALAAGRPARLPFVLLVLGLLAGGLLSLLMLNTMLAQDAFVLHDLQVRTAVLADQEQSLKEGIATEAAPQTLAARATRLGMVPSRNPVFLRVSDGRVLGVGLPALAPPKPVTKPTTALPAGAAPTGTATSSPKGTAAARHPGAATPTGQARPKAPAAKTAKTARPATTQHATPTHR